MQRIDSGLAVPLRHVDADCLGRSPICPLPMRHRGMGRLNTHMRAERIFPKSRTTGAEVWKVYDCLKDGNCFFDCVQKALNSNPFHTGPPITTNTLRWLLARLVTPANINYFKENYLLNIPEQDEVLVALYKSMNARSLQNFIMTRDHYATMLDVSLLYEMPALNIIPIVVNGLYKNKSVAKKQKASTLPLVYGFARPSRARYMSQTPGQRRYILLYQRDEHFRLIVNTEILVPKNHCRKFGVPDRDCTKPTYRAIFSASEVPPRVLSAFEALLT